MHTHVMVRENLSVSEVQLVDGLAQLQGIVPAEPTVGEGFQQKADEARTHHAPVLAEVADLQQHVALQRQELADRDRMIMALKQELAQQKQEALALQSQSGEIAQERAELAETLHAVEELEARVKRDKEAIDREREQLSRERDVAAPAARSPARAAFLTFNCKRCGAQLEAKERFAGLATKCTACARMTPIPNINHAEVDTSASLPTMSNVRRIQ
jgi:chromosome segregation ATPase